MEPLDSFNLYELGKANLAQIRNRASSLPSVEAREVVAKECDSLEDMIKQAYATGQNELLDEVQLRMLKLSKYLALITPNP